MGQTKLNVIEDVFPLNVSFKDGQLPAIWRLSMPITGPWFLRCLNRFFLIKIGFFKLESLLHSMSGGHLWIPEMLHAIQAYVAHSGLFYPLIIIYWMQWSALRNIISFKAKWTEPGYHIKAQLFILMWIVKQMSTYPLFYTIAAAVFRNSIWK